MSETTKRPPVPAGVDLHDFSFTPIFRAQLFRSAFHATATSDEWRAGVTLWLKSWDQVPAGSLPNDDTQLARLAEFGRDLEAWRVVKRMALDGWYLCADGRLYHDGIAEGVMAAYVRRLKAARCDDAALDRSDAGDEPQPQSGTLDLLPDISHTLRRFSSKPAQ